MLIIEASGLCSLSKNQIPTNNLDRGLTLPEPGINSCKTLKTSVTQHFIDNKPLCHHVLLMYNCERFKK